MPRGARAAAMRMQLVGMAGLGGPVVEGSSRVEKSGSAPQDHFLSRAFFSSLVSLLFQALLLKPNSLGSGFVLPTLTLPPLFRNS